MNSIHDSVSDASSEYETGTDYPAVPLDEDGSVGDDDDPYGPEDGGFDADPDHDIYGEDDPFPEDEIIAPPPRARGGRPLAHPEVTRIEASDDEDEESEADENATRAGPPIHLEVISGPDQGKKRRFRSVRMVIGRTPGCDFKLSDNSVSRRHLELVLGDDGVLLRDLGSGNGTKVNGEKIDEKLLEDGDEIAIGKTRFRFVDELAAIRKREEEEARAAAEAAEAEAAAAAQAEADAQAAAAQQAEVASNDEAAAEDDGSGAAADDSDVDPQDEAEAAAWRGGLLGRSKALIAAGIVAVLLAGGLVATFVLRKPEPPPVDPAVQAAVQKMDAARAALANNEFEQAIALMEEAAKRAPGTEDAELLATARKEWAAQKGVEEVRALVAQKQFGSARERLAGVVWGSVVNESLAAQLTQEIDVAEATDARARVDAALGARDLAAAEAAVAVLPAESANTYRPQLATLKKELAQEQARAEREARAAALQQKKRRSAERQQEIDEAFVAVSRKFHQGEFGRAALECDRVVEAHRSDDEIRQRAVLLKRLMPLFGRYLDEGQRKYRSGNLSGAAKPLRKARDLYQQIGFEGALGPIIDERLAEAAVVAGKSALARNELSSAARNFKDALALTPGDPRPQQGLDAVIQKGQDLYYEAYMIRDRDPKTAARQLRTVLEVLPSTDPTYEKAKAQLDALGR